MAASASVIPSNNLPKKQSVTTQLIACLRSISLMQDPKLVLEKLKKECPLDNADDQKEVGEFVDYFGNTVLHYAVETRFAECVTYIGDKLGPAITKKLVKIVNDMKLTPQALSLCIENPLAKEKMIQYLLKYASEGSIESVLGLSVKLDPSEILKSVPEAKDNKAIHDVLRIGYDAINQCRADVKESDTHPQTSKYTAEKQKEIKKQLYFLRKRFEGQETTTDVWIKTIREIGVANCGEFKDLMLYHLSSKGYPEIFNLEALSLPLGRGDHQVVLVNRDISKFKEWYDFESWGETAAIFDAWAGKAYLVKHLAKELMGYEFYSKAGLSTHTVVSFNHRFHHLNIANENEYCMTQVSHSRPFFTPEEIAEFEPERLAFEKARQAQVARDPAALVQSSGAAAPSVEAKADKQTQAARDVVSAKALVQSGGVATAPIFQDYMDLLQSLMVPAAAPAVVHQP